MAEAVTAKPPPKRRRILDPSAIVPVPIYSSQVSSSLQLKAPVFGEKETTEEAADDGFWSEFSCEVQRKSPATVELSDSEDDVEQSGPKPQSTTDTVRSPSPPPPPPESVVQKPSRKAKQKLNEIDRRLQAVNSLLSPGHDSRGRGRGRGRRRRSPRLHDDADDDIILVSPAADDDDLIITSPETTPLGSAFRVPEREIPLKVRCRTDLHKIPVLPSTPLSAVVDQLSVKLRVPPTRLLLLREEAELSTDATVHELGLGIADIIECVVMAAEAEQEKEKPEAEDAGDVIKVRLQGKDKDSAQEFSLRRDAPLGSVFSQYVSRLSADARRRVRFHFDGCKVTPNQTPAQLDMEDGDIVEVWA